MQALPNGGEDDPELRHGRRMHVEPPSEHEEIDHRLDDRAHAQLLPLPGDRVHWR
jgi:hypothetical protein